MSPAASREASTLRTVLLGGAAGSFATPDELDVPLTFEDLRAAKLSLGSGVVMVLDQTADLTDVRASHRSVLPRRERAVSACRAAWARCVRRRC